METGDQPPKRERSKTPAIRIKAKLREAYPGVQFKVRFTRYVRDRDMVQIRWTDQTVKDDDVQKIAKPEFDGNIFVHYSPYM